MGSLIKVKGYKQKKNGKVYIVKSYNRRKRALGKKLTYKPVGTFMVAHDELGNFRGSRVVLKKAPKKKKAASKAKKAVKKKRASKYS